VRIAQLTALLSQSVLTDGLNQPRRFLFVDFMAVRPFGLNFQPLRVLLLPANAAPVIVASGGHMLAVL
jgi:hypothetical protein